MPKSAQILYDILSTTAMECWLVLLLDKVDSARTSSTNVNFNLPHFIWHTGTQFGQAFLSNQQNHKW